MVAKSVRTVGPWGRVSVGITIPRDCVRGWGIKLGTKLEVRYGELLLVVPPGKEALADRLIEAAGGSL